jgi:hypothetical protein
VENNFLHITMGVSCVGVHAVTSRRVFYESFFFFLHITMDVAGEDDLLGFLVIVGLIPVK